MMDIIAAHRLGLIEKLDQECADLAGRAGDFAQRAIMLHHLYDHSLGAHRWALAEAVNQLAIDEALQRLERATKAWWRGAKAREAAAAALAALRVAMGEEAGRRALAAYRAYRIAGTPALAEGLGEFASDDHGALLVGVHAARRDGMALSPEAMRGLAEAVEADLRHDPAGRCAEAWQAIDTTFIARPTHRLLDRCSTAPLLMSMERRGPGRLERRLRDHPFLPAAFRANPAQHFYALQHGLAERRRREWIEGAFAAEALAA